MSQKRISHLRTAPLRRATDRLTRVMVSGGGVLVLLALLLIFCYLLWVVLPLFRAPAVSGAAALATYPAPTASAMTPQSPLVSAGSASPSVSPQSPLVSAGSVLPISLYTSFGYFLSSMLRIL